MMNECEGVWESGGERETERARAREWESVRESVRECENGNEITGLIHR